MLTSVLERIRNAWRDHVTGPTLRTYDVACEELGGAPWRVLPDATDRWFINKPDTLNGARLPSADKLPTLERLQTMERLPVLDTGALVLKRAMSERTKLVIVGGSALTVIAICLVSLAGGGASHAMPSAAIAPASASVASPSAIAAAKSASPPIAVAAVTPTPLRTHAAAPLVTRPSPSVQALFSGHTHAPARRHVARHRRR